LFQKQIKDKPKVIHLNIDTGPFIVGLRNPVIVLPPANEQVSKDEIGFILLHELEHFRHHHILLKICIEIVASIYWWNPIVWLLRGEVIRALEMQADTHVIQGLSNKEGLSYLETLIHLSRKRQQKQDSILTLSFSLKSNMMAYRISTAYKFNYLHSEETKTSICHLWPLILSTMLLLFSIAYTFESYDTNPVEVNGTFSLSPKNDYFILREDGAFDLFINGEYTVTLPGIPEDLSSLSIH